MKSSYNIQYSDSGKLVYFQVDVKELFNVDLNTPGIISALNYAFNVSKSAVPIKTGLMLKSYTIEKISNTAVRCYFDPKKIIGKKRLGYTVKEYYPAYLVQFPSRINWLDIVIKRFYDALLKEMEKLAKKDEKINLDEFYLFLFLLISEMKKKAERQQQIEEARKQRQIELDKERAKFQKSLKRGGKK